MDQPAFGSLSRACLAVTASVLAAFSAPGRAQTAPASTAAAARPENSVPVELSSSRVSPSITTLEF